ncbi:MAG: GAF domain-containing protein [Chloroflexi bacterium]|nr:GAF domain-containing protein [Chloroflexota bacterium]
MKSNFRTHLMKWGIVVGLTIFYWFGSARFIQEMGDGIVILGAFPIITAGWYFGMAGGFISALLMIAMNLFIMTTIGGHTWENVFQVGFIFGSFIFIGIGLIGGRLKQNLEARVNAEAELQSREKFLTLLNDMTRSIIIAQSFEEMMQTLVKDLTILLNADTCYITRWDPVKKQVFPVATNARSGHPFLTMVYPKDEKNLTTSTLEAGHILIVEDSSNTPHTTPHIIQMFSEKSFMSIPLIYGEYKLGAAVVGFNDYRQFTQGEIKHAEQASNQIALAVWNAQQDFELKKRLKEADTLTQIVHLLSETERIGLQTVLQLIVNSAKELIPATEQAVIHLLDEEQQLLKAEAVIGYSEDATSWRIIKIRPNEGAAGQAIVTGEIVNIADVRTDPRFQIYGELPVYRSLVVAPVQSGSKKLGTISVQSSLVNAFTEDEGILLKALGTQASIAIENARLLESTQQSLKEANSLYRINQGLVTSLDPQELLQDVVELLQKNFGYYHVQIYVIEPETSDFVMRAGSGEIGRKLKERKQRLHSGEGIVGYTAEIGIPFFTNDVDNVYFFVRNSLLPDTKSELAVPVKIDERILGVLDIQQVPPRTLAQRDIQLVSAVADQLAIALQKANLYTDLQTSLKMEQTIRAQLVQSERLSVMGRLLASVSHELNNPLQAIQNALFLLREEKGISTQGKQDLDIVLSESERMSALINRLRTTYRSAQLEDFLPTQVNHIIEEVYALIATHLRHTEISFEFHPDPELPLISGLADQLHQVILNLMMNAVEAMASGGHLTVTTKYSKETEEIILKVSDSGEGIDPSILPTIFDAFVTDKTGGTGLGLTITYDIVTKHRGRIQAENNPQGGATFTVCLPREQKGN